VVELSNSLIDIIWTVMVLIAIDDNQPEEYEG